MCKPLFQRAMVAVLALMVVSVGQTKQEDDEPSVWMKTKLSNSQQVLNGLVTGDFELIQSSALAMRRLNAIEHFARQRPAGYRTQLRVFQFSVDELVRHAEHENLDGAALAFTQMTLSCVNCHKQLREGG